MKTWLYPALIATFLMVLIVSDSAPACCPAPPHGKPVVNADQTVVIIWDAATHTEHFIRRASFKSEADDFGFLIPTPAQPQLNESGNEAFAFLSKVTAPETIKMPRPSEGMGCGCSAIKSAAIKTTPVRVLEEKTVAGFHAEVLDASSTDALVDWLKAHDYAFSPEVAAWAKPYVDSGWKITALKVAKSEESKTQPGLTAGALRITFKTDRPLFPYREPDSSASAKSLGASDRLLRIYFVADARYNGALDGAVGWTGRVAWANKLSAADRKNTLDLLKLPETEGPAQWWLTEFEDHWPYRTAPGDLYFSSSHDQGMVKRPPNYEYTSAHSPGDATPLALAGIVVMIPMLRCVRGGKKR